MPIDGRRIFARLTTVIDNTSVFNDYEYDAADVNLMKATLIAPAGGSTISTSEVTFERSSTDQSAYRLEIGTTESGNDVGIYDFPDRTITVTRIPLTGGTLYVRLSTLINNEWRPNSYTYATTTGVLSVELTADPMTIDRGGESRLTWTAVGARRLVIDNGVGVVTGNSIMVRPMQTVTYSITATGSGGSVTHSVTVTVRPPDGAAPRPSVHVAFEEGSDITAADTSGNGINGELRSRLQGGPLPQWVEGTVGLYALAFNGSDTAVDFPKSSVFDASIFTIALWLSSVNSVSSIAAAVKHSSRWQLVFMFDELCFVFANGDIVHSGYRFPRLKEWHHYAVVVNDETMTVTFYVDGSRFGDPVSYPRRLPQAHGALHLGRFDDRSEYRWNGEMDDFRFYAQDLDGADIAALVSPGGDGGGTVSALQPGRNEFTITHNGLQRSFIVQAPAGFDRTRSYPVVFAFHWRGGSMNDFPALDRVLDDENAIGVYPQGENNAWNSGFGYEPSNADDVAFVREIYQWLRRNASIEETRVYALGLFGGGGMAYRLAAETDIFAAVASLGYSLYAGQTVPSSAPHCAVLQIHGDQDALVPYDGGRGTLGIDFFPAQRTMELWATHNGFTGAPAVDTGYPGVAVSSYFTAGVNPEVILYTVAGQGHYVADTVAGVNTCQLIWDFFRRNEK